MIILKKLFCYYDQLQSLELFFLYPGRVIILSSQIAPLRVRPGDIIDYQRFFARTISRRRGQQPITLTADAIRHLESYSFPDNAQVCTFQHREIKLLHIPSKILAAILLIVGSFFKICTS